MAAPKLDSETRHRVEEVLDQLDAAVLHSDYDSIQAILELMERHLRPWEAEYGPERDADPLVHDIDELLIETQLQILRKSHVDAFADRLRDQFELAPRGASLRRAC